LLVQHDRACSLDRLTHGRAQVAALPFELYLPLSDARHVEKIVDESREERDCDLGYSRILYY
jgi:hypothetical protein